MGGADPSQAPFTKALVKAEQFVIVRNNVADLYSRIWCCWELYLAKVHGLTSTSKLLVTGPQINWDGEADVGLADSWEPEDKRKILEKIRSVDGMYEDVN